jgi:hypothetical protein
LVRGFRLVVEAFQDELARAPRVVELLAILRWGARTLPGGALADAYPDEIVGFDTLPPARNSDAAAVDELNDNAFVLASNAFNDWWRAGTGVPITAAGLGSAILEALHQVAADCRIRRWPRR